MSNLSDFFPDNSGLYPLPSGAILTGNIIGLEYYWNGFNVVQVSPGICMDSTNDPSSEPLVLSAAQNVSIPITANTQSHFFLCDDGVVRRDTHTYGPNLGAYRKRWIGFVTTDASGSLRGFKVEGDVITFTSSFVINYIIYSYVRVNLTPWLPEDRVDTVSVNSDHTTSNTANTSLFYDNLGSRGSVMSADNSTLGSYGGLTGTFAGCYFWTHGTAVGIPVIISSVKMKR